MKKSNKSIRQRWEVKYLWKWTYSGMFLVFKSSTDSIYVYKHSSIVGKSLALCFMSMSNSASPGARSCNIGKSCNFLTTVKSDRPYWLTARIRKSVFTQWFIALNFIPRLNSWTVKSKCNWDWLHTIMIYDLKGNFIYSPCVFFQYGKNLLTACLFIILFKFRSVYAFLSLLSFVLDVVLIVRLAIIDQRRLYWEFALGLFDWNVRT